jgi:Anti-sigma-K factor rskA, C-terminal
MNDRHETYLSDGERTRFDTREDGAVARLVAVLEEPSTWFDVPTALEDAVVDAVSTARAQRRRGRRRVRRVATGAVAVAATIALVVGLTASGDGHPAFRGRLTATGSLPAARGSAEIYPSRSGFRVALDAEGLPELPRGRYYEGWLSVADGSELPIGTFSSSKGVITLWSGLSSADFFRMTVTIESVDNDQAPSRDVVLAGRLQRA